MQIKKEPPRILQTWLDYVNAHERAVAATGEPVQGPSFELLSSFAGAFVAGLSGGILEPGSRGKRIVLPDGEWALVTIVTEDWREDSYGLVMDPVWVTADWVVLVAFRMHRPVVVHVFESKHLFGLSQALRTETPSMPDASPSALVLSRVFHWNLCLEPLIAEAFGVRTYYLSDEGISREPHPLPLPSAQGEGSEAIPQAQCQMPDARFPGI